MSFVAEYRDLLTKYTPRPIRSAEGHQQALRQLEELMVPHPDRARSLLIEVLATLVEKYEARTYSRVEPQEMLARLLKSQDVKPADVAKQTGIPAATLSNVLAGRRGISKANAIKLGRYFDLSPVVFLAETSPRSTTTGAEKNVAGKARRSSGGKARANPAGRR